MIRLCKNCGALKPSAEFYRHKLMTDGYLNQCKECVKQRVRLHRRTNESVRAYDRKRARTPERKEIAAKRQEKYRTENEAAYKAQNALNNALRDGKIKREPCALCSCSSHVHAHHRDYSDPLNVTWLCAKCHARAHAHGMAYT